MKFIIYGEPKAKGRPRFRSVGKFVKTYNDEETTNYENLVKLSFVNSGCPAFLNNEPIKCTINLYRGIPKSVSKKKQQQMLNGEIRPTNKPDVDNCIKSIFDGLNTIAFNDDKQIVELHCYKFYDTIPRAEVELEELKYEMGHQS